MEATRRTPQRVTGALLVTLLLLAGALAPAAASDHQGTEHCPNHQNEKKVERNGQTTTQTVVVDGVSVTVAIDGKTVSFTDSEGNPLEVEFCVKASTEASGLRTGTSWTTEGNIVNPGGQAPDISYVVVYRVLQPDPIEPDPLSLAIAKTWTGDDADTSGVTVDFELDTTVAEVMWRLGSTPLTVTEGQVITILDEHVTGLPEGCTYTASLPGPYTVDAKDAKHGLITLTVVNTLDCDEVGEPDVLNLAIAKVWTGDEFDRSGVTVSFELDTTLAEVVWTLGSAPLEVTEGQVITVITENVTGLPEGCTYTASLPGPYTVDAKDAKHGLITLEVTNDVTCVTVVEPTALFSFQKNWDGDEADLDDVTVTFTIGTGDDAFTWQPGDAPVPVAPGQVLEPITETVTGLPDECTYTSDLPASYTVPMDVYDGETIELAVTNTLDCDDAEIAPTVLFSFEKEWDGDDLDLAGVTVTFTIGTGDAITWQPGDAPVPVAPGQVLEPITETVTGLSDECTYTSDLEGSYTVPGDLEDGDAIALVVTNTLDCDDAEIAPSGFFSFEKEWAGDDLDLDGVTVTFTIGTGDDAITWQPGDAPVAVAPGQVLAPMAETVTGLPDTCDYTSNLADSYTIPANLEDGGAVVLVVTNTVDCADVAGVVIERPGVVREVVTRVTVPTEVLGVAIERAAQLPRTGASLAGLLALSLAGLTLGGTLVRRRTR